MIDFANFVETMASGHWITERKTNGNITISRGFGFHAVSMVFKPSGGKYQIIEPPSYPFKSRMSHIHFTIGTDLRHKRSKTVVKPLIRLLEKAGMWDKVINKDFVTVNPFKKGLNRRKIRSELREIGVVTYAHDR